MNKRDKKAFERVFGGYTDSDTRSKVQTVAEYIATHEVKTERRTSKKGVELIKVHYSTGTVKEYELANISKTCAFEH